MAPLDELEGVSSSRRCENGVSNLVYLSTSLVENGREKISSTAVALAAVGNLRMSFVTRGPREPGSEIERLLANDPTLPGVAIAENDVLVGLISRETFLSLMARPFGPELYRSRPIQRMLDRDYHVALTVSAGEGVGNAARMALARTDGRTYDPLVVAFPDRSLGVLDMQTLLQAVASTLEDQMLRLASTLDELRRTQSRLVQVEKLASLGSLVAGVAHEVNTPVGIVLGTATHFSAITRTMADLVKRGSLRRSELDDYLGQAEEAARLMTLNATRAAELIHGFKQVSVDQTSGECRVFVLHAYLDEILTSLGPRLKSFPVAVDVRIPEAIECNTNPGALSQIITNLVVNSLVHGFEGGRKGRIEIAATLDASTDIVRLVYSDDGKGIDGSDVPKVFDPFFTTRRGSGGSGLGLHITHNLVVGALGGWIELASAPGMGVRFEIRFPRNLPLERE